MRKKYFIFLLIILLPLAENYSFSQNFRFKTLGAERGLSNKYINNINQSEDGYIWLGSGEGIFRFDGFKFVNSFSGDTIPQKIVVTSFKDSKNRLWFGYRDGSIAMLEGIHFKLILTDEDHKSSINGIAETKNGQIIAATQDKGLVVVGNDFSLSYISAGLEGQLISSINLTPSGELLTGTFDGLYLFKLNIENSTAEAKGQIVGVPFT